MRSSGGYGGRGGDSGRCGRGCACPSFIYGGDSDKKVSCRNGQDGRSGRVGENGKDGENGMLFLVMQGKDLRSDKPTATISMASMAQSTPINLSNNLWKSNSGAGNLLAPSSIVTDTYQEYIKRWEKTVVPQWKESQPVSDFKEQEIGLELTEQNKLNITYPEEVWLDAEIADTEQKTSLIINHAVAKDDTTELTRGLVSGSRDDLVFTVIDEARKSDILDTKFKIEYRTSGDRFTDSSDSVSYKTRYEGIVPAATVKKDGQRFSLALGQFVDSEYLRPGTLVDLKLTAIRSLGNNSAEQEIDWEGEINN